MPAVPYLPSRDADLLTWADAFSGLITAGPTTYGLTAPQASTLAASVAAYETALATATNASTRTTPAVAAKDAARADMVLLIQSYVAIIQATPTVTEEQLADLGLTIRSDVRPPISAPTTQCVISSLGIVNLDGRFSLADETTPSARRRPVGVIGAEFWYKVGGPAPIIAEGMSFGGLKTRTPFSFALPSTASGQIVYFRCRWMTARGLPGPWGPLVQQVAG
jgi:hypothetical protein